MNKFIKLKIKIILQIHRSVSNLLLVMAYHVTQMLASDKSRVLVMFCQKGFLCVDFIHTWIYDFLTWSNLADLQYLTKYIEIMIFTHKSQLMVLGSSEKCIFSNFSIKQCLKKLAYTFKCIPVLTMTKCDEV